jgi:hypothetical protein
VTSDHFASHQACASCHLAQDGNPALRDATGRDISMVRLWRSSMMSLAGRDPVYLAAFAHELEENPAARALVETTCTRCHTASASVEHGLLGTRQTFAALTTGTDPLSTLARDGVTCTVCHQIRDEGLGTAASFTGGFVIGTSREIFGPHASPFAMPMRMSTGFTPVESAHVREESGLCATCHTVITRALDDAGRPTGPSFPEQVPYLEWRNSDFAEGRAASATCQRCHVPTSDVDGEPISTRISTRPLFLSERAPVGRHVFRGGNAYVLDLVAENAGWVGTAAPVDELRAAAEDSAAHLRTAASVHLERVERTGDVLRALVRVDNHTGHRFPTGYPSRRAWLRISGLDAGGAPRWISGRVNASGALVDVRGERIDTPDRTLPHRQVISSEDEVQVWHAEMLDVSGRRTHTLLRAAAFSVDDRILPRGWSASHPDAALTSPVGTSDDPDFMPGSDRVEVRIPLSSGATRVRVELLFQSVPPTMVDAMADHPTPMYSTLLGMVRATPPTPVVVSTAELGL